MNKIPATITHIQSHDLLNIVNLSFGEFELTMMSLELDHVNINDRVILVTKPSFVAIGKGMGVNVSYSNQIKGKIVKIEEGELLSSIYVDSMGVLIQSILVKKSAKRLNLKTGDEVFCIINASDLSILEVLK